MLISCVTILLWIFFSIKQKDFLSARRPWSRPEYWIILIFNNSQLTNSYVEKLATEPHFLMISLGTAVVWVCRDVANPKSCSLGLKIFPLIGLQHRALTMKHCTANMLSFRLPTNSFYRTIKLICSTNYCKPAYCVHNTVYFKSPRLEFRNQIVNTPLE